MRTIVGKVLIAVAAVAVLANPPRKPLKNCPHCGAGNEPSNTSCVSCLRRM